jgi:hypothetical protein
MCFGKKFPLKGSILHIDQLVARNTDCMFWIRHFLISAADCLNIFPVTKSLEGRSIFERRSKNWGSNCTLRDIRTKVLPTLHKFCRRPVSKMIFLSIVHDRNCKNGCCDLHRYFARTKWVLFAGFKNARSCLQYQPLRLRFCLQYQLLRVRFCLQNHIL